MVTTVGNWKSSMVNIKNIIFDFDGTLADTSKLIVATMQKSIYDYGLPFRNEKEIRSTIGVRLEEIPSILWPSFKDLGKPFAKIYRNNFEELKDKIPVTLFPGVKDTLSKLKTDGYQMSIATSRSHRSVEELTGQLGVKDNFVYLLGGDDVEAGKPDPESINKTLIEMSWLPDETMMVGDMKVDILMGKNAGTATCGVDNGNGNAEELKETGADFIISKFPELIKIL